MEDDLNFFVNERRPQYYLVNGRQTQNFLEPQFFLNGKTTSFCLEMEDNFIYIVNGR